jgi:predicted dehydrogenase
MTISVPRKVGPKRPRRVALLGAGNISHYHLIAWSRVADAAQVVAICDPDFARAKLQAAKFSIPAAYASLEEALGEREGDGIDVLDIAAPRETHARYVELAADRSIDVLCQKPLTPTLGEAEALVRRVAGKHRLMVHENWRFRPWYRRLGDWVRGGDLGEARYGHMQVLSSGLLPDEAGRRHSLERQPFMVDEARLMITEVLIHHLDVLRWLLGPLRVIGARATRTVGDVKGDTLAAVFLETAAGSPVVLGGTMAAPGFPPGLEDHLTLVGDKASIILAGTELRRLGSRPTTERFEFVPGYQQSFDGVIGHFVACLESGASFETDPVDNLETLRLVEHAYWASGLHRPEPLR